MQHIKVSLGNPLASSGTYSENLTCGGRLNVSQESWSIEYYFPGPDRRYTGEFFVIPGPEVHSYIKAYEDNWNEYERLIACVPAEGSFEKPGLKNMVIRIGGHWAGVSISGYHLPISSRATLDRLLTTYRYCLERAPLIQDLLAAI
jgi:hypothetical protein